MFTLSGNLWLTLYIFFSGANTGIGKETVLELVKRGARVILLCRNEEKAKKVVMCRAYKNSGPASSGF